jgi:hypothetical protein
MREHHVEMKEWEKSTLTPESTPAAVNRRFLPSKKCTVEFDDGAVQWLEYNTVATPQWRCRAMGQANRCKCAIFNMSYVLLC